MSSRNPAPDPIAIGRATGQDRGPGRGTHSAGRVALGEANPFRGELVEVGRVDDFIAVAAEVSPAHVIDEEDDDVGGLGPGEKSQ